MTVKTGCFLVMMMILVWPGSSSGQEKGLSDETGFRFSVVSQLPATGVKNQYHSGSCWSFSALSFLESELLRMGKGEFDLSEMFCVRHAFLDKANQYVRNDGKIHFGSGGAMHDVTEILRRYGMVPEEVYDGIPPGGEIPLPDDMVQVLRDDIDGNIMGDDLFSTPSWQEGYNLLLNRYLGEIPATFSFNGTHYTSFSFASMLGLDPDDYVEITSFTHHPFYSKFAIEVPDNWSMGKVYNLPLVELMQVIDHSLENGYTVAWSGDVTERGYSWEKGVALVPDRFARSMPGTDSLFWKRMDDLQRQRLVRILERPVPEKKITQAMRQEAFENHETSDDHGMHITGIARDRDGNKYYIVKNSWGTGNPYQGYCYVSEAYIAFKTTSLMVNKNAIPDDIRGKLGL